MLLSNRTLVSCVLNPTAVLLLPSRTPPSNDVGPPGRPNEVGALSPIAKPPSSINPRLLSVMTVSDLGARLKQTLPTIGCSLLSVAVKREWPTPLTSIRVGKMRAA